MIDDREFLKQNNNMYIEFGLETFSLDDGVPLSLKAILFNRYMHWSYGGTVAGFKTFYFEHYLNPKK